MQGRVCVKQLLAEEYDDDDDLFDFLKMRRFMKNNGQKCPRFNRLGWSNEAM